MPELASLQNNGKETMNKIFALNVTVIWLNSNKKRKSNNCIHSTHDKHRAWRTVFERWQDDMSVDNSKSRNKEENVSFLKESNGMNGECLSQELESATM